MPQNYGLMRKLTKTILAFLPFTWIACAPEPKKESLFELIPSEQSGIDFENQLVSSPEMNILEYLYFYNGGGVAAGDINNDGWIDLYFTGNQVSDKLYLNKGNFQFEDITEAAGIPDDGSWSNGVTMADVNGDGLLDIFVSQVGDYKGIKGKNRLYINQGDLTFIDLGSQYGVDFQGFGTHSVFFDYDRDGDLDLYLLNHGIKSPEVFTQSEKRNIPDQNGDKLLKNLAMEGQRGFVDVTGSAGIFSSILGFGLGVSMEDFNGDAWPDLYVSNDFTEDDYLYLNNQDGTFTESLARSISNTSRYSMGNDAADINGDGLPEILTTDMLPENPEIWMKSVGEDKAEVYAIKKQFGYQDQYVRNHFQLNLGNGEFGEAALFSNISASDWSWSPLFFDMDNDGKKDLHITNGIVKRPNDLDFIQYSQDAPGGLERADIREKQIKLLPSVQLPNYSFRNLGSLRFEENSENWGLDQISYSNGSTYADLDNDGDLDLIINNLNQKAFLYQNHSEKSGNSFLKIRLKNSGLNQFGIGSEVRVYGNGEIFRQFLSTSRGFQSGTSTELLFGLGKIQQIDSIQVRWPEGTVESYLNLAINQSLLLIRGAGKNSSLSVLPKSQLAEEALDWKHQENKAPDETKREYLIPRSFSMDGPASASADINGDGLTDLYLGGAKNQAGAIFLQSQDGSFHQINNPIFDQLAMAEDVAAIFEDFDADGNLDLYVGSAGNEFETGALYLFDRVFFGDGQGHFRFSPNSLPKIGQNTSTISSQDVNGDGFVDLFVGTSVIAGDYGASPPSFLLINDGKGNFSDETANWFGSDLELGMVQTAIWKNLVGDEREELILSGHWQSIRVFENTGNQLKEIFPIGLEKSAGWINTLLIEDINGDNLLDIVTGNLGLNSKLKASHEKPVMLYHHDFDANGQADPLIFHDMKGKMLPFATRDDLIKQIPGIKRMHNSYAEYSQINGPESLFDQKTLDQFQPKMAYEFRSGVYFQQADGSFEFQPFPWTAQLSPIHSITWQETQKAIWLGGNFSGFRMDLGKSSANPLSLFSWEKEGWKQKTLPFKVPNQSEIRSLLQIHGSGSESIFGITHNGPVYILENSGN